MAASVPELPEAPAPAPIPEPPAAPAPVAAAAPEVPPLPAPVPPDATILDEIENANELAETAPARRPRSKARLALAIGLPALALAAVGYHFGKGRQLQILESPALGSPSTPTQPAEPAPAPAPAPNETAQGSQPPPPPERSEVNDAQETLIAFLGAPDWQARSAFVLSPEEVRPEMEKHAKANGDGPIPASAVELNKEQSAPPVFVFKVCTKAMPDGFPVPVIFTDEGPKIDWESFTAFNDDHFNKLLQGPPGQIGIFNLLVKPELGEEPSPHFTRFRLSVPMPGREATSWVRRDSVALARLKAVFDGSDIYDKETVDKLVSEIGLPLRLAVAKRRTNDGREFIEVVEMVAGSWGMAKP
ncbi:hypothetical protein OKA05_24030 [Luteolibacter arcticus]|uniref:Uncharacterized protein n=1 Tax=Luteolibacter arcticus TaxID=1581411 RepID=A0ABT3GQ54_9BACT|nr:hypothetical protein [Luteolibacter arcticus]